MHPRCFLGHGASGTAATMAPFVEGLRTRGIDAHAIDLPKRKAEDAIPAFHLAVPSEPDVAVGGHSFGGRVAREARLPGLASWIRVVDYREGLLR